MWNNWLCHCYHFVNPFYCCTTNKLTTFPRLYVIIMSHTSFRVNPHSIVCLNVRELLPQSRCHIWSLSDSNVIGAHKHLVSKRTLDHLAKWLHQVGLESCCCYVPKVLKSILTSIVSEHAIYEYRWTVGGYIKQVD